MDFVDQLMTFLGRSYYVAMLSAAELHGAAHQRPQVFQVMVDRIISDRDIARVRLRFYRSARLGEMPYVLKNSRTAQVRVSSPEATVFDLAARPRDGGGLFNVATVTCPGTRPRKPWMSTSCSTSLAQRCGLRKRRSGPITLAHVDGSHLPVPCLVRAEMDGRTGCDGDDLALRK